MNMDQKTMDKINAHHGIGQAYANIAQAYHEKAQAIQDGDKAKIKRLDQEISNYNDILVGRLAEVNL